MFNLISVELDNFRSFAGHHRFVFPTEPGLYSITGVNKFKPRMGPNGIGKSTFLEAVYWCLYGATTRGLKAADVVTWGKKWCRVQVTALIGETLTVVTREQSPNKLGLEQNGKGHPVEQDELTRALRLTAEAFKYAVLLPQFGTSFFDKKPAEKLSLFSQILGLEFWLEKSDLAASESKKLLREKDELDIKISRLHGELDTLHKEKASLLVSERAFQDEKQQVLDDFNQDVIVCRKEIAAAEAKVLELLRKKRLSASSFEDDKNSLLEADQQAADKLSDLLAETAEVEAEAKHSRAALARLNVVGGVCEHCRQSVSGLHLRKETQKLTSDLADQKADIERLNIQRSKINAKRTELGDSLRRITQAIESQQREKHEFETRVVEAQRDAQNKKEAVLRTEAAIASEKNRVNPFGKLVTSNDQQIAEASNKLARFEKSLAVTQSDYVAINHWVLGFKRIRLLIIEEVLCQLELEVNNNLTALGLDDWQIKFDVERENKKGSITKGFVVMVYAPGHKDPVRLEAWSGGETQRLRMAADLGLANLIMEQAGLTNTIEFFDEPSNYLSSEGLTEMAALLADRADTNERRIFLIDHHAIEFGGFTGTINIIRTKEGSRISE